MTYQRTANNCFKPQRNKNIVNKEYRVNYAVISNKPRQNYIYLTLVRKMEKNLRAMLWFCFNFETTCKTWV